MQLLLQTEQLSCQHQFTDCMACLAPALQVPAWSGLIALHALLLHCKFLHGALQVMCHCCMHAQACSTAVLRCPIFADRAGQLLQCSQQHRRTARSVPHACLVVWHVLSCSCWCWDSRTAHATSPGMHDVHCAQCTYASDCTAAVVLRG